MTAFTGAAQRPFRSHLNREDSMNQKEKMSLAIKEPVKGPARLGVPEQSLSNPPDRRTLTAIKSMTEELTSLQTSQQQIDRAMQLGVNGVEVMASTGFASYLEGLYGAEKMKIAGFDARLIGGGAGIVYGLYDVLFGKPDSTLSNHVFGVSVGTLASYVANLMAEKGREQAVKSGQGASVAPALKGDPLVHVPGEEELSGEPRQNLLPAPGQRQNPSEVPTQQLAGDLQAIFTQPEHLQVILSALKESHAQKQAQMMAQNTQSSEEFKRSIVEEVMNRLSPQNPKRSTDVLVTPETAGTREIHARPGYDRSPSISIMNPDNGLPRAR